MQHDPSYDRQAEGGWAGIISGEVGEQRRQVEISGGWPSDPRPLWARLVDQFSFYAMLFVGVVIVLAIIQLVFDAVI